MPTINIRSVNELIRSLIELDVPFSDIIIRDHELVMVNTPRGLVPAELLFPADSPMRDLFADVITMDEIESLIHSIQGFNKDDIQGLIAKRAIDGPLRLEAPDSRVRLNAFKFGAGKRIGAVARRIIKSPIPLEKLGLPHEAHPMLNNRGGLILVAGQTGKGKSTTISSIIDHLRRKHSGHIITLENPIETIHEVNLLAEQYSVSGNDDHIVLSAPSLEKSNFENNTIITQREVGTDVSSFSLGVEDAMRERPFAIVIGEIRDRDTAEAAIYAGESGHLVIAAIHAEDTVGAVARLCDFSGVESISKARTLSSTLNGVLYQQLAVDPKKEQWLPVFEVLVNSNDDVESGIADQDWSTLRKKLSIGKLTHSKSLNDSLEELVTKGAISLDEAQRITNNRNDWATRRPKK